MATKTEAGWDEKTVCNRRYKLGLVWAGLINLTFYLCLFKGLDIGWYTAYAKDMTLWFAIIVGGLTLTDLGRHVKGIFTTDGKK